MVYTYAFAFVLIWTSNDLAWDGESKRIIAVGDGRETYVQKGDFLFSYSVFTDPRCLQSGFDMGHFVDPCILVSARRSCLIPVVQQERLLGILRYAMDIRSWSPSRAYVIDLDAKVVNAVSIRQQRPFKAATASDDTTIVFHSGMYLLVYTSLEFNISNFRCTFQVWKGTSTGTRAIKKSGMRLFSSRLLNNNRLSRRIQSSYKMSNFSLQGITLRVSVRMRRFSFTMERRVRRLVNLAETCIRAV